MFFSQAETKTLKNMLKKAYFALCAHTNVDMRQE
jgi:hypothetical protein